MSVSDDTVPAGPPKPSASAYFDSVGHGRNRWWHCLLGISLVLIIYVVGSIGLFGVSELGLLNPTATADGGEQSTVTREFIMLTALLISFLFLILGVCVVQHVWHRRAVKAVFTSAERFRWGNLFRAVVATIVILSVISITALILDPSMLTKLRWAPNAGLYLLGLAICIALVPFQAASEELFFRGYLNQAMIQYVPSPWLAYLVTSCGFALLHAPNSEAQGQLLPYLAVIFTMGLGMSVLLHFEGGLEGAMGYHIANNLFGFCLLGYEVPDLPETGLVYLTGPIEITWATVGVELLTVTCVVTAIAIWNRRCARNHW